MKIDFDIGMKTIEGEDIKIEEGKSFTLKNVAITALTTNFDDEKNISGEEKLARYVLACKIRSGGECDLKADDIVLLKKLIGKAYGVLISGQAWQILEN